MIYLNSKSPIKSLNICMATSYYAPHISGLTLYFQRLAEELATRNHTVTMLTSRFDPSLPKQEKIAGVQVIRTRAFSLFNKFYVTPFLLPDTYRAIKKADILHLNLPAMESIFLLVCAKLLNKKVVVTYVCDIVLPPFFLSNILNHCIDLVHRTVVILADCVVTFTEDFARHSRVLRKLNSVQYILPPTGVHTDSYPNKTRGNHSYSIGMATRISSEKGIDVLLDAIEILKSKFKYPFHIYIAGNPHPRGEEQYSQIIHTRIHQYPHKVTLLGQLKPDEMPQFLRNLDVLVVASTNATEAFGLVQIEAMREGTPVIATDLPGVRVPVQLTGMGRIISPNNPQMLAEAIIKILKNKSSYRSQTALAKSLCTPKQSADEYTKVYLNMLNPYATN